MKKKTSRKRRKDGWLKSSRILIARLDIFSTVRQKFLDITIQSSLLNCSAKNPLGTKTHWIWSNPVDKKWNEQKLWEQESYIPIEDNIKLFSKSVYNIITNRISHQLGMKMCPFFFIVFFLLITTLAVPYNNGDEDSKNNFSESSLPVWTRNTRMENGSSTNITTTRTIRRSHFFVALLLLGICVKWMSRICEIEEDHICWSRKGNPSYSTSVGRGCSCDINLGRHQLHLRERFYWQPHNCRLLEWNATQFCDFLGDRTISMIGDSTMEQIAATLV